ncbi:hypothetical protein [Pararoseomonas baculiformis]|uniref:hypothetical protein n=1 Tax=Pararoseomonas baculiformis TaxID=2820812 RepID=UPI001FD803B4|nr:hypothetical protein [Pararoseomonas baculiformis]
MAKEVYVEPRVGTKRDQLATQSIVQLFSRQGPTRALDDHPFVAGKWCPSELVIARDNGELSRLHDKAAPRRRGWT